MPDLSAIPNIALKDTRIALRDRFLLAATLALVAAALISLITGTVAMRTDVATYMAAKQQLLALGKNLGSIAAPEFYPLTRSWALSGRLKENEKSRLRTKLRCGGRRSRRSTG